MTAQEDDLRLQLENLKSTMRALAHDLSNHLGVLRMSAYYLQNGEPDPGKRENYYAIIGDNVDKIVAGLAALRGLGDEPHSGEPPVESDTPGGGAPS